jgi:hypothetical protein
LNAPGELSVFVGQGSEIVHFILDMLSDQTARQFPVQGLCGVPVGAKAVTVNVTAVVPSGPGFLTLYPSGIATPVVSSLNFAAGELALGNGAIVPLADQSQ